MLTARSENLIRGVDDLDDTRGAFTGTLDVGTISNSSNATFNGILRLGWQQEDDATNAQVANGIVNLVNGTLTANNGVQMGSLVQPGGTTSAILNVEGGLATLNGAITDSTLGTSAIRGYWRSWIVQMNPTIAQVEAM